MRALTKKMLKLSTEDILQKFLEDEKYYIDIGNPHFEFLENLLDDNTFIENSKLYISECKKYYEYKKSQQPIIEAQKEFEKKKRAFLREVKMSKEQPTKKQIYYYEKLCKKYDIEAIELTSKLQARDEIDRIIKEYDTTRDFEDIN